MTGRADNPRFPDAFTLIELLAAIMVMTVLVLILLPAFRSMQSSGLRRRAAAQAAEIAQAALDYRQTYGTWPLENEASKSDDTALIIGGEDLGEGNRHLEIAPVVNLLRGLTREGDAPDSPVKENPRDIVFLELPASSLAMGNDEGANGFSTEKKGTPLDPWGRPYVLVLALQRQESPFNSSVKVGRIEGGVETFVEIHREGTGPDESFHVESPDDAVAFSWGDPDTVTNAAMPTKVIGSWSQRE